MGERSIRRIPQQNQELDFTVVVPNSFHRVSPIDVNRGAGAQQSRFASADAAPLQRRVINLVLGEPLFIIKKMAGWLNNPMQLVFMRHLDFRMALQEIRQRSSASLLRSGDDEIQLRSRLALEFEEHGDLSAKRLAPSRRGRPCQGIGGVPVECSSR